ncbi:hypothetical protein B0A49_06437, partial [Cryomyces minteri]
MSPSAETAESLWLAQLSAMREAIAELKLPRQDDGQAYGQDIVVDDEDFSGTNSSDDIWDLISDDEDDPYSSDQLDGADGYGSDVFVDGDAYDQSWLRKQCMEVATRSSGLDSDALQEQLMAALSSNSDDGELQMLLADVLGYNELEVVTKLLAHRGELVSLRSQAAPRDGVVGRLLTKQEREEALRRKRDEHKNAALGPSMNRGEAQYPHVYRAHDAGNMLSAHGCKYALPLGSERTEHEKYEEYSIPATKVGILGVGRKLVEIQDMDGLCKRTFKGYKALNRMQSLVYPVAYKTSENMLICAPTGAAKNMVPSPFEQPEAVDFTVKYEDFKIVYVAPMKALAAEITEKLGKRLAWLGIQVRELTGDMHLTKKEIVQTQILVTTPEKWDVVTRKSTGDTELVQKVRLLIIDEVHMLHDERGAVLESLVARTERQVESTQSLIRIVGLSATLPNYVDVADFLKVNRMAGLFYFDGSFRPVPLEQHFVGVKGKAGSKQSRDNMDQVAFEKVKDMLLLGHQIMVFVHSRKDTVNTARKLYEMAIDQGYADLFDPSGHESYSNAVKDMKTSKGRELRELLPKGMGTHHAGMPRSDRNLIERLFAEGILK